MTNKVSTRFLLIENKAQMGQFTDPPHPEAVDKGPKVELEPICDVRLVADQKDTKAPTEDINDAPWRAQPRGEISLVCVRPQAFGLDKFPIHAKVLVTFEIIDEVPADATVQ